MSVGGGNVPNPVDLERAIVAAADEVYEGVDIVIGRFVAYRDADRTFDAAYASAYMMATGNMEERKQQAVLATLEERKNLDVAEASWRYAERRTKAAESKLSAFQSVLKRMGSAYQAAGVGDY